MRRKPPSVYSIASAALYMVPVAALTNTARFVRMRTRARQKPDMHTKARLAASTWLEHSWLVKLRENDSEPLATT